MGFVTQCILMFLLGTFNAWLYSRKLRARNKDWSAFLWLISNIGMWTWGILLYLDVIPIANLVNWIPWVNVADGKDWMWNSFQLVGVDFGIVHQTGMDSLAVIIFLSYPCWYLFGGDGGRMLFGKRTYEEGYWWAIAPLKKPADFKSRARKSESGKKGEEPGAPTKTDEGEG
ncbi:MAG: hypothetical protein ACTSU5_03165 [Promethearchaeota archaeon]